METEIIRINPPDRKELGRAARYIQKGELVAFPTETVYGLGANALDGEAVAKIFKAKNRPCDNPLIVHISDQKMLEGLVTKIPQKAGILMEKFWPGPLTIIFPKSKAVPDNVTCGLQTVAVRMPSHPIARELIRVSGVPIAAPSANISGKPSPTQVEDVIEDLNGKVACIIDGGDCEVGVESTVLDLNTDVPTILRPGGVSKEELEKVLGKVEVHAGSAEKPASPGMKYRHYAPKATVVLVEGLQARKAIGEIAAHHMRDKKKVGVLVVGEVKTLRADAVMSMGTKSDEVARNLFRMLREMDRIGVDVIVVEGVEEKGRGLAVMNRLRKAASQFIIDNGI